MHKEKEFEKELVTAFQSGKAAAALEALRHFSTSGYLTAIPHIMRYIADSSNTNVANEAIAILSNLKDEKAVPLIMEGIRLNNYGENSADVVAICWQSGLDFSEYVTEFIPLFVKSDYQTALEAFSVIEEAVYNATLPKRNECLKFLEQQRPVIDPAKQPLLNELIKVVKCTFNLSIDGLKSTS